MKRVTIAALAALFAGSGIASTAFIANSQERFGYLAPEMANSVPPSFYGVEWERESFNQQDAIMNAGIMAAIHMNKARVAALNGQLTPVSSYTVSPTNTARVEEKMLGTLGSAGANDRLRAEQIKAIHGSYADYVADAKAAGESPDSFVTACAYYVTTSLEIEHDKDLTEPEKRAVRGDCVTILGARQQGVGLYVSEPSRQLVSQSLATVASFAYHAYQAASPDQRASIKAGVESGFHQFFGSTLAQIPVDHLACAGAPSVSASSPCYQLPNSKFAAIADNTK